MVELSSVNDKSTKVVTVAFLDEDGNAVVPTGAAWTLTNEGGAIINNRNQEPISPLASSSDVVLSGNDLKWADGRRRYLVVEAVYNGVQNGLTLNDQVWWKITNLKFVV